MNQQITTTNNNTKVSKNTSDNSALLLGTSLALVSMILIPALATRIGLGASLTGALRIAMMKASHQAVQSGNLASDKVSN